MSLPSLTTHNIQKYLTGISQTHSEHARQQPMNIQSMATHAPTHLNVLMPCHSLQHQVSTDLTGKFPIRSSQGHQYLMATYIKEPNSIITHPMVSHKEQEWHRIYTTIIDLLHHKGFTSQTHIFDNEIPQASLPNSTLMHIQCK